MLARVAAVVVAGAMLLGGCSGGNSSTSDTARGSLETPARCTHDSLPSLCEAVRSFTAKEAHNEIGSAYRLVSARCRAEPHSLATFRRGARGVTDSGFTIEAYTKPPNGHGWVEYYFPDTPFTHPPQSWVMEGGKWRWDGCFPFQMPAARPR